MPHRFLPRRFSLCVIAALSVSVLPYVRAETPSTKPAAAQALAAEDLKYLRFVEDPHGSRLETAIVTFRNDAGVTVRLVGAVHIGEKSYYQGLNDTFRSDDAVLYEMVKPKDADVPKPNQPSKSGIGQFQHYLKDALNLDFQLDDIDYSRPNFVHADMDSDTFAKMQEERGESMFTLMIRQMMDAMSNGDAAKSLANDDLANDLITMLCRPDAERQVKLMLARHMGDMEKTAAGLGGPNGSVILTERNKAAMKVLADTLAKGTKHISVFYGAAHMAGMTETLEKEMGFKPVSVEWRMAWDLAIRSDQPSAIEKLLREGLNAIEDN